LIRRATTADTARVVELLRNSREGAGFDSATGVSGFVFPFDAACAERLFLLHLKSRNAACFLHDVEGVAQGILMVTAFQHPYGPVRVAKESLWWIEPAHRGGTAAVRMLDAYETWARGQGCAFAGVAGMGDDPAVGKLYARRGYRGAEVHYLKGL
jgi:GNAT superfamily N-acetyltransferase